MTSTQWDPATYLKFADERTRPFLDLVARIPGEPGTIVDLGCGPGHLTQILRGRWPDADILGVDSSEAMINRATTENSDPRARYVLEDIARWSPGEPVDLIISNAAFQWVPSQLEVIPRLQQQVSPSGALALQVPNNFRRPSHALLYEFASRPEYAEYTRGINHARGVEADVYLDLLSGPGWEVDVWQTTYLHVLQGDDAVFHWISGTGARPVLYALPDDLRATFVAEYQAALREAYPRREAGTVLPFDRVFAVARRV